jgi:hypothetical protein
MATGVLPATATPGTIAIVLPWSLLIPLHPPSVADVVAPLLLPVVGLTRVLVTVVRVATAARVAVVTMAALLIPPPLLLPGGCFLGTLLLHVCLALLPVGMSKQTTRVSKLPVWRGKPPDAAVSRRGEL